jgi:hypothetical protein
MGNALLVSSHNMRLTNSHAHDEAGNLKTFARVEHLNLLHSKDSLGIIVSHSSGHFENDWKVRPDFTAF